MHINTESIIILQSVDSTNNYAMQQVHSGLAKDGDCWFALEQTQGRGRRGKHWLAQKGENIMLSIVADTLFLKIHQQFQLSVAISMACYDLFKGYDNINTKIKWPNDLFWNDRKAGGILIENSLKGNIWQWAVIGVGLNINQTAFEPEANRPVSLQQITGNNFDVIQLAKELYSLVAQRLNELKEHRFNTMLNEYNEVLYKKNDKVRLKKGNIIFETTIIGVSANGQLETMDSMERFFGFDEVEWIW